MEQSSASVVATLPRGALLVSAPPDEPFDPPICPSGVFFEEFLMMSQRIPESLLSDSPTRSILTRPTRNVRTQTHLSLTTVAEALTRKALKHLPPLSSDVSPTNSCDFVVTPGWKTMTFSWQRSDSHAVAECPAATRCLHTHDSPRLKTLTCNGCSQQYRL